MSDLIVQQIPIPIKEKDILKEVAKSEFMDLYKLVDTIADWYLVYADTNEHQILSCPKSNTKYWSFLAYEHRVKQVHAKAVKFSTSNNRIWYTAIKLWMLHKNLL